MINRKWLNIIFHQRKKKTKPLNESLRSLNFSIFSSKNDKALSQKLTANNASNTIITTITKTTTTTTTTTKTINPINNDNIGLIYIFFLRNNTNFVIHVYFKLNLYAHFVMKSIKWVVIGRLVKFLVVMSFAINALFSIRLNSAVYNVKNVPK